MLTVATAHVFRDTYSCHLDDLHYVCLLPPYVGRPEPPDNTSLTEGCPATLRLRQVLQEPYNAMLHLDIGIGLQQRGEIGSK